MTLEYTPAVLADLEVRVAGSLERWGLPPSTVIRLLNVSENATYALSDAAAGRDLVLRVHRVGYSSRAEIRSELQWIEALRAAGIVDTAAPIAGVDGGFVQTLTGIGGGGSADADVAASAGLPASADVGTAGAPRFAVAFERLPGREPDAGDALHWFERLGEVSARLHGHARAWVLPADFRRKIWDFDAMVGPAGFWGPWRAAIGLDARGVGVIEAVLEVLRERIELFGRAPEVFGLLHADLRLANLLVDDTRLRIIDFDDCGFSWFAYDFATAVSFIEHEPVVPALLQSWLRGYRRVAPVGDAVEAEIPTFVMLRRILLTAWLASHAEVPLSRTLAPTYTAGTVRLAESFLRGDFLMSDHL